MKYKKLTQKFFMILLGFGLLPVILLVSYDPLHLYHKSWFSSENKLHGNMRLQAAGIINNYEFDSMIVGTSMLAGTSSKYASEKLGGKFINISAPAGNLYERNLLIKHALRNKNINHIIYSFDTGLNANLKKNNRSLPLNKFNYLYDNNPLNDIYAYWNNKFLKCMISFSKDSECIGGNRGLIRSNKWSQSLFKRNKVISGVDNWIEKGRGRFIYSRIKKHLKKPFSKKQYKKKLALTYKIIDKQLLDTIEKYKDTSFHIVFPPYSRLIYALWLKHNPRKYQLYKETLKYLIEKSQKYNNMHIYLLDDLDYLDNLNNYRDMRHYNTDMNKIIINYIRDKKEISSLKELAHLFNTIDNKNSSYTILDKEITKILQAYKFRYDLQKKYNSNNKIDITGWALSYKLTSVDLYINNEKIKNIPLKIRKDISKKYPHYKQAKSGFVFKNVKINPKKDKIRLFFKNKHKVVKKINVDIIGEK